jgi:RNA polymerase sigma-70 factor (ECF subfamily)
MPPDDYQETQFTARIGPHFERLYRLAYRLTGNRTDAEDLLQDVMVRLYEQRHTLDAITDLKPWLSRVLYNRFVDGHRAEGRRRLVIVGGDASLPEPTVPGADGETLAAAGQRLERLDAGLQCLSREQQEIVLLHDAEGYTLAEVSVMTGTPVGTLKSRLSRARARLRELLRDGSTPSGPLPADRKPGNGNSEDGKKMEPFSAGHRAER